MALDPSISLGIKVPEQPNALDLAGKALAIQGAMNQNKLFGAKQAAGRAVQGAIDPTTGQYSPLMMNRLVSADPDAAAAAGDAVAQGVTVSGEQLKQHMEQLQQMRQALGSVLAKPDAGPEDAKGAVLQLVKGGILSPKDGVSALSDMPTGPEAFKSWLVNHYVNTLDAEQKGNAILGGAAQTYDDGKTKHVVRLGALPGQKPQEIMSLDNAMTPDAAGALVDTVDPVTGQHKQVPKSAIETPAGSAKPNVPGLTDANGAITTSLPAGSAEARSVEGQGSAQQGLDLQKAADAAPAQKAALQQFEVELPKFASGPAANFTKQLGSLAAQFGIAPPSVKEGVGAQEEAAKLSQQIVQTQFQALGGTGTDAKLDSASHTSPNEFMSRLGAQNVSALLKGNTDAIAKKNQAWQAWRQAGNGPETYGQFSTQFNKIYNPRVFMFPYMSPDQQSSLQKSMSPREWGAFQHDQQMAKQLGWVE